MALTKKVLIFCKEYTKDYNGRQAAIRAGYKESNAASQASKLLHEKEVIEEIQKHQKELLKKSCLTEEKVIIELQNVFACCMSAVPVMKWDYEKHEMVETGKYQIDAKGALKALEMLGKHLGMFERKENNKNICDDGFMEALEAKAGELEWQE